MSILNKILSTVLFGLLAVTSAMPLSVAMAQSNTAPAPGFTINPSSGDTNTIFTFDGSLSTDLEDGSGPNSPLELRWDFNGDGNWDTSFSQNKVATHVYPTPNTYNVLMEVRDTDGNISNLGKTLTVNPAPGGGGNTAPAPGLTISPTVGDTNTIFTFDGSLSTDLEDGSGPNSPLEVRFDFEGDGIWDTNFSQNKTATHTYSEVRGYTVLMEVRDTDGNVTNIGKQLVVMAAGQAGAYTRRRKSKRRPNKVPIAALTASKDIVNTGEKLILDASDSSDDRQHRWLLFKFDFNGDGTYDTDYSHKRVAEVSYDKVGNKNPKVMVRDMNGAESTASVALEVTEPKKVKQPDLERPDRRLTNFYFQHEQFNDDLPEPTTDKQLIAMSKISHEMVEGNQVLRRSIILKNTSEFRIRNIKLAEIMSDPTNGGRLMLNRPNYSGSNFFPKVKFGNMHNGYLMIDEIPAAGVLKINYDLVTSALTVPAGEESRVALLTLIVNTGERLVDTVVIKNSKAKIPEGPMDTAKELLPMALMVGAVMTSRRRLIDSNISGLEQ